MYILIRDLNYYAIVVYMSQTIVRDKVLARVERRKEIRVLL